jgi:hypothetical protein
MEVLAERMSYSDLMRASDPKRIERSARIPAKSMLVRSVNDRESWKFSYKTPFGESETGLRHTGFIYFFKDGLQPGDNAMSIDCSVDCSCPDYKYRWAYNNAADQAGELGATSLNKNNGSPPKVNLGNGLCKHLLSLKEYLNTRIESDKTVPDTATDPATSPKSTGKPVVVPKSPDNTTTPQDSEEPPPQDGSDNIDKTQSPDPENPASDDQGTVPVEPTSDTPQEPEPSSDDVDAVDAEKDNNVDKNTKKKLNKDALTESDSAKNIARRLDVICNTHRLFIL